MKRLLTTLTVLGLLAVPMVQALEITDFDEVLAPSDVDKSKLSAKAEFLLSGNTLTLTLINTSLAGAGSGAGVLLTGIGFSLPDGIDILSGSADMTGSAAIGFTAPAGGDVSDQWGFANAALAHFQNPGTLGYNAVVSTMTADTGGTSFPSGAANNIDGPDYGLLADGGNPGGLLAIQDSLLFTLTLSGLTLSGLNPSGTAPPDLLYFIESHPLAVTFGSPPKTDVPDGGTTLALLGLALAGTGVLKKFKA